MKIIYLLPYNIPAPQKLSLEIGYARDHIIIISFSKRRGRSSVPNYYENIGVESELDFTLVEVEFPAFENKKMSDFSEAQIQRFVHLGIYEINSILAALVAEKEIMHLVPIGITDLPMLIPVEIGGQITMYVTDPGKLHDHNFESFTEENFTNSIEILRRWNDKLDLSRVNEHFFLGKQKLANSQYKMGIIDLQTSFEIYVNKLLRNILKIQQRNDAEIDEIIEENTLKPKLERHIGKNVDADLSYTKNEFVIRWKNDLYDLRNRLIHEGIVPLDRDECLRAMKSLIELYNHIAEVVERKFPHLVIARAHYGVFDRSNPEKKQNLFDRIKTKILSKP